MKRFVGVGLLAAAGWVLALPALADTLAKIEESGTIAIGFREDSRPFSFRDDGGGAAGYSVDLCERIASAVKAELGLDELKVGYVPVSAETRFDMLEAGKIDIECGSTTNTLARQERAAFTLLTFATGAEMLTRVGSGIADLTGAQGKKLGVLGNTTTETGLKNGLKRRLIEAEVVLMSNHEEGLAAVEAGQIDAYFADRILLLGLAKKAKDPKKLKLSGRFYSYEPYALMVRRDDDAFRLVADRALARLYRSREIESIYRKWFGKTEPSDLLKALYVLQGLPKE